MPKPGDLQGLLPLSHLGAHLDLWILDSQKRRQTQGWLWHLPDRETRSIHTIWNLHRSGIMTPIFWEREQHFSLKH